jgi:arabinogalactan endo-1,4-beta-galactosidase
MLSLVSIVFVLLSASALGQAAEASSSDAFAAPFFYQGHDLSSLKFLEETGTVYKDSARNNQTRPAEDILGDGKMNSVRLRYDTKSQIPPKP